MAQVGGAIAADSVTGALVVDGSHFKRCVASVAGGCVQADADEMVVRDSTLEDCEVNFETEVHISLFNPYLIPI